MRFFLPLILFIPLAAAAQQNAEVPGAVPGACHSAGHRQFDFWVGDWTVSANGQTAGTNSIQSIHNGCALQENWQGAGNGGVSGTSLNLYDTGSGQWHQTWVDSTGTLLLLNGGLVDGSMVLSGRQDAPGGAGTVLNRIRWTPNDDGSVRQLWEASRDDGANWDVLFDGLYTRVPSDE